MYILEQNDIINLRMAISVRFRNINQYYNTEIQASLRICFIMIVKHLQIL